MKNKLVIVDGNSILYRAFFALPSMMTANGKYTNAIYGFANMIIKTIQDIKPTHMAVAFDVSKRTFRTDMFEAYKGTRKPMPDELRSQIEPVKTMLSLMKIKVVEKENFEADDIIGTLSKKFDDTETIIITGDRDSLQLISKTTTVYLNKKGLSDVKVMDLHAMQDEYGMTPDSFLHLKALQGDNSDNIPGVPGIGPKTAIELIQKYKTLDGVYAHLDELKPGVKSKLEQGKDMADLSFNLSRIRCDVPLDDTLGDFVFDFPFSKSVYNFMEEYRFSSLLKRSELFKEDQVQENKMNFDIEKITTLEKLQNAIDMIEKSGTVSLIFDENENICFAIKEHEWQISSTIDMFDVEMVYNNFFEKFAVVLENPAIRKVFFDLKQMLHFFDKKNIKIVPKFDDVALLYHLCEGVSVKGYEDVLIPPDYDKSCLASSLLLAYENFSRKIDKLGMTNLYGGVELPLLQILFDMEKTGFKVDRSRVDELGKIYRKEISTLVEQIYELAGERFNINSSKQLSEILFDKLGLPHNKKKSTGADVLEEIASSHEIVPLILRYRKVNKLLTTYIDGLIPHIDENDLVHTCFKQTITNTGRLSSVEPNLQNIPIRSEESREVRSIYIARSKDNVLIDADYSQIELRLLAHCSQDEFFLNAFKNNLDVHTQTACQVFGVNRENVTPEMRRIAKVVNFGIIYGISDFGLANDLKISPKQARAFIQNFYEAHPKVKDYMNQAVEKARETGRVSTLLGRTRRMLDINASNYMVRSRAERAAQNMPLQGSAADIIKLAMIKVYNALSGGGYKAKLIMQVHDELIVDCPKEELEEVSKIVKESMNTAYELRVPLVCDITASYRWSDGH